LAYNHRQVTTGVPLYLVSACGSSEEFVAAFRRYADRTGLFIPIAAPLPQGKKGRIALTLKDGGVMVEGEAEIVQSSQKSPLHGRAGIVVKFTDPDEPSRTVLAELEKARLAMKPSPPSVPPRPADVPAEPRPVPPAIGGRIDAANALAECVVVGDTAALRDAESAPPKAGQKFVVPAIPAVGGRPRTPTGAPEGRAKTPTGVPEIKPPEGRLTTMGMPAIKPPADLAPKKDPTPVAPKKDPTPPTSTKQTPTSIGVPPVPSMTQPMAVEAVSDASWDSDDEQPAATARPGVVEIAALSAEMKVPPPTPPGVVASAAPKADSARVKPPGAVASAAPKADSARVKPPGAVASVASKADSAGAKVPLTTQPGVVASAAAKADSAGAKVPLTTQPGVVASATPKAKPDSGPVKGPTTAPGMAAAAAPKTAAPTEQKPVKSAKMTQLGIPVVKMPADVGSRPEPPKATTLGMVPLRASVTHQTQPVAVVAPPKDAAVITNKPPRDEPPGPPKKPPLPAPTPTRSKSPTTPPRAPTPAVPLPVARVPAKSAPAVDPADETTDLSEVPVPQTDFGFPNVEAERTERPAPPPEPELRPQRSGGMRASEIMAAVQVDDWTMTPDASAPTVIPSSKQEPAPEVQEPTPAPKGPPTGNWTISLDPSTETGWSEPAKVEPPPPPAEIPTKIEKRMPTATQTPQTGNPVHAIASDKAIEAVQWEDKPTSIGEKIEIDPTLMEPLHALPLDDGGGMPAYGSMSDLAAASSPELPPPPLMPPPLVPNSTGAQPAYPPQDIGYAATLLPGQMQAPPGGFAYPAAPPQYQAFPGESVATAPRRSSKRVIVIAASAAAVVILVIVLALTMGGKHGKRTATGKDKGSAAVVVPPPPAIDAAVEAKQQDSGPATQQVVTPPPPPPPQTCTVDVTTTPAGAEVSLEDKTALGATPGTFTLPCGTPTKLIIRKSKYVTASRTVTPTPDGAKLSVALSVGTFSVKVTSSPAGAMITVGGKPKGVTPTAIQLPAFSTQTITLTKDGYVTDSEKVVVKSNGVSHHVTLKRGGRRR
jgi:hypothetical protein